MTKHKLGLRKQQFNPKRMWLAKYINFSTIKVPPTKLLNLGTPDTISGMLCNGPDPLNPPQIPDGIGCCFWAAAVRGAAMRRTSAGKPTSLTQPWAVQSVLRGYASTGFNIDDPSDTDNGTDPDQGFKFLQQTGLLMPDGTYDKIATVLAVNPQDPTQIVLAHNLFDGLMVGVQFPQDWEDDNVWDATNSQIVGGHEIFDFSDLSDPALSGEGLIIDSWGTKRLITWAGLAQNCNQLSAIISLDMFNNLGQTIEGFDLEQLQADAGIGFDTQQLKELSKSV